MALDQIADGGELMRRLLGRVLQELVEAQATAQIGAARHERTEARTTQCNGSRDKSVSTTAGDLTVRIPKLRPGCSSRRCWRRAGGSTWRCTRW